MGSGLFGDEILTERKKGALLLLSAYMLWGVLPIYWKALFSLDPVEILAHRILWSMVIAFITVAAQKKFRQTAEIILHDHKTMLALSAASLMITFNWGLFIWAVNNGMILATSLGYFINPLMSIVFGMVFFHEKLSRPQRFAIILAVTGVCSEIVSVGRLPYVSLALALSFGSYGVIKKLVKAEAMVGYLRLWRETRIFKNYHLCFHLDSPCDIYCGYFSAQRTEKLTPRLQLTCFIFLIRWRWLRLCLCCGKISALA